MRPANPDGLFLAAEACPGRGQQISASMLSRLATPIASGFRHPCLNRARAAVSKQRSAFSGQDGGKLGGAKRMTLHTLSIQYFP